MHILQGSRILRVVLDRIGQPQYHAVLVNSLIAQLVERRTVNPQVPGSSPGRGARISLVLHNPE